MPPTLPTISLPPFPKAAKYIRYILALQLTLGSLARLPLTGPYLLPAAHRTAMAKAEEMADHLPLPFVPSAEPERHSQIMGAVMLAAAGMLCVKSKGIHVAGAVTAGALLSGWAWAFWQMGAEWPVPVVNVMLCGIVAYGEMRS